MNDSTYKQLNLFGEEERSQFRETRETKTIPLSIINKRYCPDCGCELGAAKLTPHLIHLARVDCQDCGFFLGWLPKKFEGVFQ